MKRRKIAKGTGEKIFPAIMGGTIVSIFNGKGCLIENYESVFICTDNKMSFVTAMGLISVFGMELKISEMRDSSVNVVGKITSVEFEG